MAYTKTVWNNNGTPPISAGNLNHIEDGIYACDSAITTMASVVSNNITYSETEVAVGTWIDGKTIYRQTRHFTGITGTKKEVAHNISDIDTIVGFDAFGHTAGGSVYRLPMVGGPGIFGATVYMTIRINSTNIEASASGDYSDQQIYVTIYYTKVEEES